MEQPRALRVLVIEDHRDAAESRATARVHGSRGAGSRSTDGRLAAARELRPDVVLCDIGLPDLDG